MTSVGHIIDIFSPHFHPHFFFWDWNISNAFEKLFTNGLISTFISVLQPSLNRSHSASFLHESYTKRYPEFLLLPAWSHLFLFYYRKISTADARTASMYRRNGSIQQHSCNNPGDRTRKCSWHHQALMELFKQSRIRVFTVKWNRVHAV